jgi:hypothetical protein
MSPSQSRAGLLRRVGGRGSPSTFTPSREPTTTTSRHLLSSSHSPFRRSLRRRSDRSSGSSSDSADKVCSTRRSFTSLEVDESVTTEVGWRRAARTAGRWPLKAGARPAARGGPAALAAPRRPARPPRPVTRLAATRERCFAILLMRWKQKDVSVQTSCRRTEHSNCSRASDTTTAGTSRTSSLSDPAARASADSGAGTGAGAGAGAPASPSPSCGGATSMAAPCPSDPPLGCAGGSVGARGVDEEKQRGGHGGPAGGVERPAQQVQ